MKDSTSQRKKYKLAVVGIGLIGGSMAAAVKRFFPNSDIYGVDKKATLEQALHLGYIDTAVTDLKDLPEDLDILFLSAPLKTNIQLLQTITTLKKWQDLLITDVGSTKASITKTADQLPGEGWTFIGGHPMAGSEKSGVGAANPFLFQNAVYVLTPSETRRASSNKVLLLYRLLETIGARMIELPAGFHDRLVAHISHLPHTVAVSLINFLKGEEQSDIFYRLAAGGYRDLTRIAQSSYAVWKDIIEDNKANILEAIDHLMTYLNRFKRLLEEEGAAGLKEEIEAAKATRVMLPANTKGFINPLVDIHVEIEDKPGVLSDITTILAKEAINIKDIAILKIRENLGGVLQVSFGDNETAEKASKQLQNKGYTTRTFA